MDKEFVSYEQAISLGKLGFNEECLIINGFTKPLKQQVFRWFRKKYDYVAYVRANESSYCWCIQHQKTVRGLYDQYDSYEEAENACIDKLIELAKRKKNNV